MTNLRSNQYGFTSKVDEKVYGKVAYGIYRQAFARLCDRIIVYMRPIRPIFWTLQKEVEENQEDRMARRRKKLKESLD